MVFGNYFNIISLIMLALLFPEWGMAQENANASNREKDSKSRISFHGEIEQRATVESNYNLDEEDEEGLLDLESTIELGIEFELSKDILGYANILYGRDLRIEEENRDRRYRSTFEIDEGFIELNDFLGGSKKYKKSSLTLGRFNYSDSREWYFDKSIDGVLLSFEYKPFETQFNLSVTREELFGSDLLDHTPFDPVNNFIFVAKHKSVKNTDIDLSAYVIIRDDRSSENNSPRFFGLSSKGALADKQLKFWTDIAWVSGTDDDENINGYGFDLGATISFDKYRRTFLTLGYAYGSGNGDKDTDFRQTDLQGNSDKFGGVASIKYYGELLDPELSNMHIMTAGIGFRISPTASVDFLFHHFRQDVALDELRNSDLDMDPDGLDTQLGNEVDVVLGFKLSSNVESEIVLGYFQPGRAFDEDSDDAVLFDGKISYKF